MKTRDLEADTAPSANGHHGVVGTPDSDVPRGRKPFARDDLRTVWLALASATAGSLLLRMVFDWDDLLGLIIWSYLLFLGAFYMLEREHRTREVALDRVVTLAILSGAGVVVGALGWMLTFLVAKGLPALRPGFFTEDLSKVGPLSPGGGAKHAIIGTAQQVGIATAVVVPVAVLTAVYLHELKGRMAGLIRFIVDAMSGLPSIVAGLLIFTVWVTDRGFSGIAGSAALGVLMLPTVTRASEEILRTVPDSLREASLALGSPQWRMVMRVVLPTALTGLVTAVILGIARAVGETAPMLLTSLGADTTNVNPSEGPQSDLPLFVWKLIRLPNETQVQRAWTGALILVALVLALFLLARAAAARSQRVLGGAR